MADAIREFLQVKPVMRGGSSQPKGQIEGFFGNHVFVVLGEPGLGKTTSFIHAAGLEKNALFVRIGEFLSAPTLDPYDGKTLYLDGLDEHRSRANGVDVMDAIISRLKSLDCPKARISCRTAEWHGGKDLDSLGAISKGTPIVQLELQPLTQEDILNLVADAEDFIQGARKEGLGEFLINPQDFQLLHEFYLEKSEWPDNRTELMEGSCNALLKESNTGHYEAIDDWVSDKNLKNASDYLASILMLSNVAGIACDRLTANKVFPAIHQFDGDLYAMKVAVGRHVFKSVDSENSRIEPKHRRIAEYMAARYLAARVRAGLSLRRVISLLTGIDGGTAPDLRGVYAWLVTMLSGMADHVLIHDPYGALIYGDAKAWTPHAKKCALLALEKLAIKDPWFRGGDWSRAPLGGLSDPALAPEFERILARDNCQSNLVSTVLDAIAGGPEFIEMRTPLLAFIRDPQKPDLLKSEAIDALVAACPGRTQDLEDLLDEVNIDQLADKDDYLRGTLLRLLYPSVIGADRILTYLKKPSDRVIGLYHVFFRNDVLDLTSKDGLLQLAENLDDLDDDLKLTNDRDYNAFVSKLVRMLIENFGEEVSTKKLVSWLELGINKYKSSRLEPDETDSVRNFLTSQDEIYTDIFFEFLDGRWEEEKEWHQIWWRFRQVVVNVPPPNSFPRMLLSRMANDSDQQKLEVLFELACVIVVNQDPVLSQVTFDELSEIANDDPELNRILSRVSICNIDDWRQEDAERRRKQVEERETRQERNIENLEPYKEAIIAGTAIGALEHYARVWFGLFTDVDTDASPMDRLTKEVGEELAESFVSGFRTALDQHVFNSVQEIAEINVKNKYFYRGFLMLAGMDVVSSNGIKAILDLPDDVLRIAIAYEISSALDRKQIWPPWLNSSKPELVESALDEFWRAQLGTNPERATGFYTFNEDEPRLPIILKLLPGLLRDFPRAKTTLLEPMLLNAVLYSSKEEILPLIPLALKRRFPNGSGQRAMWIATGFAFSPIEYYGDLETWLFSHESDKWSAFSIIMSKIWDRDDEGKLKSSKQYRKFVVEILGRALENVQYETGGSGWVGPRDAPGRADDIRRLIHSFAEDSSNEAALALAELYENTTLAHWRTDVHYAIANQVRTARTANFTYPDVAEVIATLADAEPANVADLKALVVDALNEIGDEIRHGNTDGYKTFWNIGAHGKATDEHVDENTARDRLLEYLRPKFRHLDIVAEPEVRYAEDKRADIAVYSRGMKLPIEIKRDDHKEIWAAAENQLKRQYSRDPASEGNGVYLVLWLDGKGMKTPPKGVKKPTNARELEEGLQLAIPESSAGLIDVVVIDASVPTDKIALKVSKSKSKRKAVKKKSKEKVA